MKIQNSIVSVQTSSGVKEVLTTSLLLLFTQYLQSKMHSFVNRIFKSEIHLPSAEKLWQIPQAFELPRDPFIPFLSTPLDVHATSYFAASARIRSFSCIDSPCLNSISFTSIISFIIHEYMFDVNLFRTFVRIIVSGVCRACLRKLLSDTKYEKKKNFCQCIRQQKFFFFHLLMN